MIYSYIRTFLLWYRTGEAEILKHWQKGEEKLCAVFWRVRAGKVCCWESIPRFPVCRKYRTNFHTWAKLSICSIFCTSNKKSNLIHTVLGAARAPIFNYKNSGEKSICQFFCTFENCNLLVCLALSFRESICLLSICLHSMRVHCLLILLSTHHECTYYLCVACIRLY